MTAERASRSDVLRAAGDVTAEGRGRAMLQTADREGTTLDAKQKRAAYTTQLSLVATK